jgi:restriction system protein
VRERRYQEWLRSEEGRKYTAFQQYLAKAKDEFFQAQRFAQQAEAEEQRRLLAEQSKNRERIASLKPKEFEQYVANVFAALGYATRLTPASNDEGIDAYLDKNGRRAIVQCKHYPKGKVSRPAVQQVFGVLRHKRVA